MTKDKNVTDLSSRRDVRARTAEIRNAEEVFARDLDVVLSSTEGRRFVWYLCQGNALNDSGAMVDAFVPGQEDLTAYRLGRQSMSRRLLAEIMKPERFNIYQKIVEEITTLERVRNG